MKSGFFKLNGTDFVNGLFLAVITVVLGGAYTIISADTGYGSGADWANLLHSTVLVVLSYLTKNLLTNSSGELLSSEK